MQPATLLFYGFVTLCLGAASVDTGPRMIATFFQRPELVDQLTTAWTAITLLLSLVYFVLGALGAARAAGLAGDEISRK